MATWRSTLVAAALVWVVGLGLAGGPACGRDVKLVVRPQKMPAEVGKYALLPPVASLTEGDAMPFYEKALQALPGKASGDQIRQWLELPIEQLPTDPVGEALEQYVGSFRCVVQAIKCRDCRWPAPTPGAPGLGLQPYVDLGWALRLWARYEIAQENYENAILALRTGFGMSRHLMQGPTLFHYLRGNAVAGTLVSTDVADLMQTGEGPNLYPALAALPKPFTDVERIIVADEKATPSEPPAGMTRAQFESALARSKARRDQVRIFANHLDANLAVVQCVEALRSYAAAHGGQLPQTLADITEVAVPKDPMSDAAFRYMRTGATAVLESTAPAGSNAKDVTRYEITVKR